MKQLKVKARLLPDFLTFTLQIIHQSHTENEFGGNQPEAGPNGVYVFVHNNIALGSNIDPIVVYEKWIVHNWRLPEAVTNIVLLKGKDGDGKDSINDIPVDLWPAIKEAVAAYNEFYKED